MQCYQILEVLRHVLETDGQQKKSDNDENVGVKDSNLSNLLEKLSLNTTALNPNANEFNVNDIPVVATNYVPKQRPKAKTTGKQRKTNVNLDNPDKEFLKSQLDT